MRRVLGLTALGMLALAGCSGSEDAPPSGGAAQVALPASAVEQIEGLLAEKAARTPAQRKIGSALLYDRQAKFKTTAGTKDRKNLLKRDADGRVLVDLKGDLAAGLGGKVEALGGKVVNVSPAHRAIRAWMFTDRLEELAGDAAVQAIRPAFLADTWRAEAPGYRAKNRVLSREERVAAVQRAIAAAEAKAPANKAPASETQVGAVTSEGSKAHGADRARKFFNTDGTGIRIGVLSDSDDFLEQSIASGDLPADVVTLPGQDGRPGTGEGTAMLQIVHDVAPGAKLFFASAFNGPESFADNIRALRFDYHCDIIVDDIIYYFESPFQDDIIALAVDDVTRDGAMYFSSAGNQGNQDDGTSSTWEGDFKPGGTLSSLPSGYTVHDFGNQAISNRMETSGGPAVLHWSDRGTLDDPQSSNDYDLFVLDGSLRNVIFASTDFQDGDDLPFEFIFELLFPEDRLVIARAPGAKTRAVRLTVFGELGISTPSNTYGHNSAPDAIGVAAVDVALAEGAEFTAGPTTQVEVFSADGPRRIFYDRDGRKLGGNPVFATGAGEERKKPELAAADGVVTTLPPSSGLNPFFGTSAAAPHAAAIAALVKAAVPTASVARVKRALNRGTLDIEGPGADRNSGAGLSSAFLALREADAKPAVFLELAAFTPGGVVLPGGSGSVSVSLVNNGGAKATAVRATLNSTTPGVVVTQRNATFPDLAPGASASSSPAFTFTVPASIGCGAAIDFSLVVTFTGIGTSPRTFNFSIATGRPGATATYAYSGPVVAIPDEDPAGVDVPIVVSDAGSVSKVRFHIDGATCSNAAGATTVGVDHSWVGDLTFKLTSPSGTTVTLIDQAGGALNGGNNFCQTVLDDTATSSIQAVLSSQAPFTGTFAPANAQSAFSGDAKAGTWTLNVSDAAFLDTGSVRAFSLEISGFDCTP